MVGVNGAEDSVDIFVGHGHSDVVATEEAAKELAELAAVQPRVAVVIVLGKVLLNLSAELNSVGVEGL